MAFATEKDILRANTLGQHKSATNLSEIDIARGKAKTEAGAITDKKKIRGRLEAMANRWNDYDIVIPFIDKCIFLWPESQYQFAKDQGQLAGEYLKRLKNGYNLSYEKIFKKALLGSTGNLFTWKEYNFDEIGIIIFNTMLKRHYKRWTSYN